MYAHTCTPSTPLFHNMYANTPRGPALRPLKTSDLTLHISGCITFFFFSHQYFNALRFQNNGIHTYTELSIRVKNKPQTNLQYFLLRIIVLKLLFFFAPSAHPQFYAYLLECNHFFHGHLPARFAFRSKPTSCGPVFYRHGLSDDFCDLVSLFSTHTG